MSLSLRVRLTLIFVGFLIGPILLIGVLIADRSFARLEEQSLGFQRMTAEKVGTQIHSFLDAKAGELALLDQVSGIGSMDLGSQKRLMANTIMSRHSFQKLVLLNTDGYEVFGVSRFSAMTLADLTDRSDEEAYLVPVHAGEVYFSAVYFDQELREPLITISIPLFDKRSGNTTSVLLAELRFKSVWDVLLAQELLEKQEIYITDAQGMVVAHRNPSVVFRKTNVNLPDYNGRAVGVNGSESLVAMHEVDLGNHSVVVIAEQPVSAALQLAYQLLRVTAIITAIVVIVSLAFILVIVGRGLAPIKALVDAAATIASGDFSRQVQIPRSKNEIGALVGAFNTMISALQRRDLLTQEQQAALQRAHDELETRVEERTADLAQSNIRLRKEADERQNAERALRKERDRAQLYFDVAGSMLMVLNHDGEVTLINEEGKEILGIEGEGIIGQDWFENYIPESTRDEIRHVFSRLMTGELSELKYVENTIMTVSGEEKLIGWHNTILYDGSGSINGILSSGVDLTQRRRLEEEQQRLQKLESVGVLAGGIAHDSNNILTAVLGSISLARLELSQGDNAETTLTTAEKACWQLKGLNQQLLTFSKGGAPIKKLESLDAIIRESCSFALRGSNTACEYVIADDLWLVEVDQNQISQVLNNLMINAVQAMPMGGTIRVLAENYIVKAGQLAPLSPGRYIRIGIQDHGIGIPADHLKRIFDPYFTTKGHGSGLGLAIAHSVIKSHGGYITAESDPVEGTEFSLYLAASKETSVEPRPNSSPPAKGSGTVLVMDDQKGVRDVLCRMIERLGYAVVSATEGASAIEIYSEAMNSGDPIDAVILDLTVPGGMGGAETMERLLVIDPEVNAIVTSGYSNDRILSSFSEYGFKGIIAKPFNVKELSSVLARLIL